MPVTLGLPRYHDQPWRTNAEAEPGRSVWICPSNKRRSNGNNLFHYCLNQNVNGTGAANTARRLASIPHPVRTLWLFDSKNLPAVGSWTYVHTNLHSAGAQITFLDGHAQRYVADSLRRGAKTIRSITPQTNPHPPASASAQVISPVPKGEVMAMRVQVSR